MHNCVPFLFVTRFVDAKMKSIKQAQKRMTHFQNSKLSEPKRLHSSCVSRGLRREGTCTAIAKYFHKNEFFTSYEDKIKQEYLSSTWPARSWHTLQCHRDLGTPYNSLGTLCKAIEVFAHS